MPLPRMPSPFANFRVRRVPYFDAGRWSSRCWEGPGGTEREDGMPEERTTRTRRRGSALETAILTAAADELVEHGYAGLTMDRVAQRAGTNKNAIYRRWPDRLALGVAAYRQLATTIDPPDTGTLREDALELLRRANRHWS